MSGGKKFSGVFVIFRDVAHSFKKRADPGWARSPATLEPGLRHETIVS